MSDHPPVPGACARERQGETEPAPQPTVGWVADPVRLEFPELALWALPVSVAPLRRSPPSVRRRLAQLSDRVRGAQAVALRREPVAGAYRIFYRHIGLDPDAERTPAEAAVLARMLRGAFIPQDRLADALLIAVVETRVPVWALDAGGVSGELGVRLTAAGERLGHAATAPALAPGTLVVADEQSAVAVLFGAVAANHLPTRRTERLMLFSLRVAGVPSIHVEEALWTAAEVLRER